MKVLKFGGSSVANATAISSVMDIVEGQARLDRVILVCSAIRGCTDKLLAIGKAGAENAPALVEALLAQHLEIINRLFTGSERLEAEKDCRETIARIAELPEVIESFGEVLSTRIIARKLACEGYSTEWIDSRDIIRTCGGVVNEAITYANISRAVAASKARIFVAPGFIARDENGAVTTLGRGGSDYSAALYAAGSGSDDLQIWTDVPGIMTANPKVVRDARTVPAISYKAALDLASHGAKVLYAPTVKPAMQAGIAFRILNTFDPKNPGTTVSGAESVDITVWKGVTSQDFNGGESEVALVGEGVSDRSAVVCRIENALSEAGIKPLESVSGEAGNFFLKVRTLVVDDAVRAIHREFFYNRSATVLDLFIAGHGAVGRALVDMISCSEDRIIARKGRKIRIVGVSDSRHFIVDMQGIRPSDVDRKLQDGQSCEEESFMDAIEAVASRKSVFVDCTNSDSLWNEYPRLFRRGLNIVTSNRRSLSVPYVQYAAMKACARENGTFFRYATTVGTALPILDSISSEANCSDEIVSIEAVVSCTLNYIISGYDGERSEDFAVLLKRAQDEGLTESDPRMDLGGRDALRKLLILSREAGVPLEEGDVEITPMLGPEFFDCNLDKFYQMLEEKEPSFMAREDELDALGKRQRFVASIHKDPTSRLGYKAEIKMQLVDESSPFFLIKGTENVIVISTEYSAPLVIKGAGEGARGAAVALLNDICAG